jgi:hypothetical protein
LEKELLKIDMKTYLDNSGRYELRKGSDKGAPLCPFGNHYEWIGFDLKEKVYIRFTKSVFKKIVNELRPTI